MPKAKYPRYTINIGKDADGKRITKTFYGKTKKEAKQKAEAFKVNGSEEKKPTLASVSAQFLCGNTDTTKAYRIATFVKNLGNRNIEEINAIDIESVLSKVAVKNGRNDTPTSERTLTRYLQTLNQVFEYAEQNRMITFNPCKYARVPKSTPPEEREALTVEEIGRISQTLCSGTLPALIMAFCGLRRGELAALTWADVDLDNKVITISKSWDYKNNRLKPPKSKSGVRTVPIPEALLKRLSSVKKKKSALVVSKNGRRLTEGEWLTMRKELNRASGVEFGWHQLRHTYASLLYDAGVGIKEAQTSLGHSSAKVTMDIYTHLSQLKKTQTADKLNAFLDTFADNLQTKSS